MLNSVYSAGKSAPDMKVAPSKMLTLPPRINIGPPLQCNVRIVQRLYRGERLVRTVHNRPYTNINEPGDLLLV